jgi:Icc-related predicted phosphoesterase
MMEISDFNDWLGSLPHKHKVVVAGNHDILFETQHGSRALLTNATYLENSGAVIEGLKFWGSPVQPEFNDWAFNVKRGQDIKKYWDMIPDDTDVLITHGPPWGLLDQIRPGREVEHLGCGELLKAVRRIKPKLHVFGHIHGGYGTFKEGPTQFVNASLLNEAYKPVNAPIVVDFQSEKDLVAKLPAFPLPRQKELTDRELALLVDMLTEEPKIVGGKLSE